MEELYNFIEYLANILQIKIPVFRVISAQEMENISKENTMAAYDRTTKTILLEEKEEYSIMDYYVLAHEMRHAWQDIVDPCYYYEDYNDSSEHEYNVSYAELDANAFACVAIAIAFNKVTKREYKNDKIAQKKYEKCLEQLKKQYEVDF